MEDSEEVATQTIEKLVLINQLTKKEYLSPKEIKLINKLTKEMIIAMPDILASYQTFKKFDLKEEFVTLKI